LPEKPDEKLENVLILAHPGHELRIHHWLEIAKPRVYLLTDGSGGKETSRTGYSRDVVDSTGATCGAVFGDIPDGAWYEALLAGDHDFLAGVFSRMRADLATAGNVQIVSDAVDGYNPIHDLAYAFGQALSQGRFYVRNRYLPRRRNLPDGGPEASFNLPVAASGSAGAVTGRTGRRRTNVRNGSKADVRSVSSTCRVSSPASA